MKALKLLTTLAFTAALSGTAFAQANWPTKTITMIVPYAAGGGAEPVARLLAEGMSKRLGQSIVVDFRGGAAGTIGTQAVVKANDGHTILFTPPAPIINVKFMMTGLSYDPDKDLIPVMEICYSPVGIMARTDFPPKTLKEMFDYAKANPGKVTAGVPSQGGTGHLNVAMVEKEIGIKLNMVPYKGTGGLLPDMLGGRLDTSHDFPAAYFSHIADGKVRVLALMSDKRLPTLPNVPTSVELGYPKLQMNAWYGLFITKGATPEVVAKLNAAANEALKDPVAKKKIEDLGYNVTGGTAAGFAEIIKKDNGQIGDIIKAAGIKAE